MIASKDEVNMKESLIGKVLRTNRGCDYVVNEKLGKLYKCTFLDGFGHTFIAYKGKLVSGEIKNPYLPIVFGKGYLGVGNNKTSSKSYRVWYSMLKRCYSEEGINRGKELFVCDEWLNYQTFAEWYKDNSNVGLLNPTNKEFSPNTVEFKVAIKKEPNPNKKKYVLNVLKTGDEFVNKFGEHFYITEYVDCENVYVKYKDVDIPPIKVGSSEIKKGLRGSPFVPTVRGKGFHGINKDRSSGLYTTEDLKCLSYRTWLCVFSRCYPFNRDKRTKSYEGCSIHPDWFNYSNFREWWNSKYKEDTWHLDKDILIKGNKIYGADTCCIVPRDINMLFHKRLGSRGKNLIGVTSTPEGYKSQISIRNVTTNLGIYPNELEAHLAYKAAKESYIKEEAIKFKDVLESSVFEAMMNYSVDIND